MKNISIDFSINRYIFDGWMGGTKKLSLVTQDKCFLIYFFSQFLREKLETQLVCV